MILLATGLTAALPPEIIPVGASAAKPPASGADLSMAQTDSPDPVRVGENVTYTITVKNAGPEAATGVTVTDTVPGTATFVSATASQGTCSGTSTVVCNLGNLAKRGSATVSLVLQPTEVGTLSNTATVKGDQADPTSTNNSSTTATTVKGPEADIAVAMTDSVDPVTVGEPFYYDVRVTNLGPSPASSVVLKDVLPSALRLERVYPGPCTGTAEIVCDLGSIPSGLSKDVQILVTATQAGTIVNEANATAAEPDPHGGNNVDSESTVAEVLTTPDLAVTVDDSADPVQIPNAVTYSIDLSNVGGETASPAQLLFYVHHRHIFGMGTIESIATGRGTCTKASPIPLNEGLDGQLPPVSGVPRGPQGILCDFGSVAPGETIPVDVTARLLWPNPSTDKWIVAAVAYAGHVADGRWVFDPGANSRTEETTHVTTGSGAFDCLLGGNRSFTDIVGAASCI